MRRAPRLPFRVGLALAACALGCGKKTDGSAADTGPPSLSAPAPVASAPSAPPDAVAIGERERATLLASRSPAQWRLLVEKYPDSSEAKEAKDKLARHESICADLARLSADLEQLLARETGLAAGAEKIRATSDVAARAAAYEKAGSEAGARRGALKDRASDLDAHAHRPGEEPAQKLLSALYWALSDATADVAEALARPAIESEESYDEHSKKAVSDWSRALARLAERAKKDVPAAGKACAPKPATPD